MADYHVFAEDHYYPAGGIGGYVGTRTDLDEAISLGAEKRRDWFEVLAKDTDTDQLVLVYDSWGGRQNHGANLE